MGEAVIDNPGSSRAEAWWFLDTLVVEHRRAPDMASVALEMTLPVGHAPALHVHDNLDDTWYVLEGQMAGRCGDDEFFVEAGHWVSMPRGMPHCFPRRRRGTGANPHGPRQRQLSRLRPRTGRAYHRAACRHPRRHSRPWTSWSASPATTTSGRSARRSPPTKPQRSLPGPATSASRQSPSRGNTERSTGSASDAGYRCSALAASPEFGVATPGSSNIVDHLDR